MKTKYITPFIILLIVCSLTYREFLETLKFFLYHKYNFAMLPLDPYYMQILFLDGELKQSIGWPWELRVIPNFANYFVYKFFPCLEVNKIPELFSTNQYCAIWSISLVNYFSTVIFVIIFFYYCLNILKLPLAESTLGLFVSFFYLSFLDRFGVDRFSMMFLLISFLIISKFQKFLILKYLFIFLGIFVNEKITIMLFLYFFSNIIISNSKIFNFKLIKKIFTSGELYFSGSLIFIYFLITIMKSSNSVSWEIKNVATNYLSFHGISNTLIPLFLIIISFIFLNKKNKLKDLHIDAVHFYIIFSIFIFIGFIIGGPGNMGRYLIYFSPFALLLINRLLFSFLFNIKK